MTLFQRAEVFNGFRPARADLVFSGIFFVVRLFAGAEDEDDADHGQEKRKNEQRDADQKADDRDVLRVFVRLGHQCRDRDDERDDAYYYSQNSQNQSDFPKHILFSKQFVKNRPKS
jgi:hypothetical protein